MPGSVFNTLMLFLLCLHEVRLAVIHALQTGNLKPKEVGVVPKIL